MRKKTQYIVVNEIYKTIYCGYPQKRAWKNFTTAEGGARSFWKPLKKCQTSQMNLKNPQGLPEKW